MVVNLVKQHSAESLVLKLRSGKSISKERVIHESRDSNPANSHKVAKLYPVITKSEDNDLVATSTVISLKCPLSTLRINVPIRSTVCTHNQCFDALSFLQLQEQAPTWTCPLCNKIVCFEALEVDGYVQSSIRVVRQLTISKN